MKLSFQTAFSPDALLFFWRRRLLVSQHFSSIWPFGWLSSIFMWYSSFFRFSKCALVVFLFFLAGSLISSEKYEDILQLSPITTWQVYKFGFQCTRDGVRNGRETCQNKTFLSRLAFSLSSCMLQWIHSSMWVWLSRQAQTSRVNGNDVVKIRNIFKIKRPYFCTICTWPRDLVACFRERKQSSTIPLRGK